MENLLIHIYQYYTILHLYSGFCYMSKSQLFIIWSSNILGSIFIFFQGSINDLDSLHLNPEKGLIAQF